jgi:hypothetical protein
VLKKKICAKYYRTFYPKIVNKLSKSQNYGFGIRDQRSGIRKKPIPDPGSRIQGVKKAPDPGAKLPKIYKKLLQNMACMYGRCGRKILCYQRDILVRVVVAPAVVLNADARHIAHCAQGLHAHCTNHNIRKMHYGN